MKILIILCLALASCTVLFKGEFEHLKKFGRKLFLDVASEPASEHSVILSKASDSLLFGLFLFLDDEYFKAKDKEFYPYFYFDEKYDESVALRNFLLKKVLMKLFPIFLNDTNVLPPRYLQHVNEWLKTSQRDFHILKSSVIEILSDTANWQENGAEKYLNLILSLAPSVGVDVLPKLLKQLEPNTENIEKQFLEVFKVHSEMCIKFNQLDTKMLKYFFRDFSFEEQVEMFQQGDQLMKFFLVEFWSFSGLEIEDSNLLQEVFYISESEFVIKYFIYNYEITLESFELFYTHQSDESFKFLIQNVDKNLLSELVLKSGLSLKKKCEDETVSFPQRLLDFVRVLQDFHTPVDFESIFELMKDHADLLELKQAKNKDSRN